MRHSNAQVTLVDIQGRPITADDQGDAATWPQSNLADGWHWEVSEDERAALEAAEVERITDLHDAPPDPWPTAEEMAEVEAEAEADRREQVFERWISANLRQQVSEEEISQLMSHGAI